MSSDQLSVLSLGFAPVKGTRHRARADAVLDDHGPVGDRRYCLIDVERRRVLKTVQNPRLIAVSASLWGPVLDVGLPDGRSVSAVPESTGETLTCDYWKRSVDLELTDGPHAALLSDWLGRPVRLARAPRGEIVYGAPISLVATASIAELGERIGHPGLVDQAARFRATALIDTDVPFVEETWQGREMALGDRRIVIGVPIPRCAVMDLDPVAGERNGRLLKALAGYRPMNEAGEPVFGVYARIVSRDGQPDAVSRA